MITVCLEYDNCCPPTFEVPVETAEKLQACYDLLQIERLIEAEGIELCPNAADEMSGTIHLDMADPTVDNMTEFLDDIATALAE